MASAESLALYEASVRHLVDELASLRAERRKLGRLLVGALAFGAAVFHWSRTASAVIALAGLTMFVVGHYVVFMHLEEDAAALAHARRTIARVTGTSR